MFCQYLVQKTWSCSASCYVTKGFNTIRFANSQLFTKNSSTFAVTRTRITRVPTRFTASSLCNTRLSSWTPRQAVKRFCSSGSKLETGSAKPPNLSRILSLAKNEKYRLIGRWFDWIYCIDNYSCLWNCIIIFTVMSPVDILCIN